MSYSIFIIDIDRDLKF